MANDRLVIIGGGVMGLGIGWQMAKAGENVVVLDAESAGQGASWAAAGMIAPVSEVKFQEEELLKLNLVSHELYPEFVAELESETGMKLGYRKEGTVIVALDRDDAEWLRNLYDFKKELGLSVEWISGQTAREIEPSISPKVHSAMFNTTDHQIDNRLLTLALKQAFLKQNGTLKEHSPVSKIEIENGTVKGVVVNGEPMEAKRVILSAGCWSKRVGGLPEDLVPPIRPVKGQMCSVTMEDEPLIRHVVRSPEVYLVPKDDGRMLIGATVEEKGFDVTLTAGGIMDLLDAAYEAVPNVYELPIKEMWAGLRPGTRDNAPILGTTPVEGLYMGTGHYRHGILQLPVTVREMTHLLKTGKTPETIAPFSIERFSKKRV
jgi:glycine oxidase